MNQYRHLLDAKNIKIVNEVYRSLTDRTVVGWMLSSPSVIRKNNSIGFVEGIIEEQRGWVVEDNDEYGNQFFVFNDKHTQDAA
jgi:hypothetical protein